MLPTKFNSSISKVCQVLNINRNKYYYALKRQNIQRPVDDIEVAVIAMFRKHNSNYGRRRSKKALDIVISERKIARILRNNDLSAKARRKKTCKNMYTQDGERYLYDNKIKNLTQTATPNQIFESDMSEFKYNQGRVVVSGIIDVATKRVFLEVGNSPTSELAIKNLDNATSQCGISTFYHTDRGSAYCSKQLKLRLIECGIQHSMSAPHHPNENQYIETFWKTMKLEIGKTNHLTYDELIKVIRYYEHYYNFERLHSSIGYTYPMQYNQLSE